MYQSWLGLQGYYTGDEDGIVEPPLDAFHSSALTHLSLSFFYHFHVGLLVAQSGLHKLQLLVHPTPAAVDVQSWC